MKKETISIFFAALTFATFAEIGCFYTVNGRDCGKRREKNSLYCTYHKKIEDERISRKVKLEV